MTEPTQGAPVSQLEARLHELERERANTLKALHILLYIVVGITVIAVVWFLFWLFLPRSNISTTHPSAAKVVDVYLSDLAKGDGTDAAQLDKAAFVGNTYTYADADHTSLLTDSVLNGSTTHISDPQTHLLSETKTDASVMAKFTLSGTSYNSLLRLRWSAKATAWELQNSLANIVSIYSTSRLDGDKPISSTFGSVEIPPAKTYAVYPGTYSVTASLPPAMLENLAGNPLNRTLTVTPDGYGQPRDIIFLVTSG